MQDNPIIFGKGDQVWLAARNIHTIRPCKKLDFKHFGPFEVLDAVGAQVYRLDLKGSFTGIHNVFHMLLLEPYKGRPGAEGAQPWPVEVECEEEYKVEEVLDEDTTRSQRWYLVK